MRLILYSKPGCHLCEGLHEKLEQIRELSFELEIRDITARDDWFQVYQYEVPVLCGVRKITSESVVEEPLPRPSPRATVQQLQRMLQQYFAKDQAQ
jgi:hypothetical protein